MQAQVFAFALASALLHLHIAQPSLWYDEDILINIAFLNCVPQIWPPCSAPMQRDDLQDRCHETEADVLEQRRLHWGCEELGGQTLVCLCDASPTPKPNQHILKRGRKLLCNILSCRGGIDSPVIIKIFMFACSLQKHYRVCLQPISIWTWSKTIYLNKSKISRGHKVFIHASVQFSEWPLHQQRAEMMATSTSFMKSWKRSVLHFNETHNILCEKATELIW